MSRNITPEERLCREVVGHYKELSKQCSALEAITGILDYEAPLMRAIWRQFDAYTALASREMHDDRDRLVWFIYDNECGKKGIQLTVKTQGGPLLLQPLKTTTQLAALIRHDKMVAP